MTNGQIIPPTSTQLSQDGLIETKYYRIQQEAFFITSDRLESLNSYSLDFQIWLAICSLAIGAGLSSLADDSKSMTTSIICWSSLVVFAISIFATVRYYLKLMHIKKKAFVQSQPNQTDFEILEASYGLSKSRDVKQQLITQVIGNRLEIKVSNATLGPDPEPGASKKLKIKYRQNGETQERTFDEGIDVSLP